jgi:hypothetical protein
MARKKQSYIKGTFTHRRTEADYMGVLLDAVPLEDWREVVSATVAAAKAGRRHRTRLAGAIPGGQAGRDRTGPADGHCAAAFRSRSLVERLAKPHIDRANYPSRGANDDFEGAMREQIGSELRALEAQKSNMEETGANADGTRLSADSSGS